MLNRAFHNIRNKLVYHIVFLAIYFFGLIALSYNISRYFRYYVLIEFTLWSNVHLLILSFSIVLPFYLLTIRKLYVGILNLLFYELATLLYYLPGIVISIVLMNHMKALIVFMTSFILHSVMLLLDKGIKVYRIRPLFSGVKVHWDSVILVLLIMSIIYMLMFYGLPKDFLTLFSAELLYEVRSMTNAKLSGIHAYLSKWLIIFAFFAFSFSFRNERVKLVNRVNIVLSLVIVFLFSQYRGQKAYMVQFIILFFLLFVNITLNKVVDILLLGISLTTICVSILGFISPVFGEAVFLIRRIVISPAQTTVYWIDWFYQRPPEIWSYFGQMYGESTADVVGQVYYKGAHINSGFIADGYANLKFAGVVVSLVIIVLVIRLLNNQLMIRSNSSLRQNIFLLFLMLSFFSTRLTTVLLSGAVGIVLILSFALGKQLKGVKDCDDSKMV